MSEVIEGSPPPRIIRDWRDWLNEFPSVKALALFCILAWIAYGVMIHWLGINSFLRETEIKDSLQRLLDNWGDKLIWLTPAVVAAIVGKRATEKPEVIRAEGEAKAAVLTAQTSGTHPVPTGEHHLARVEQPSAATARDMLRRQDDVGARTVPDD